MATQGPPSTNAVASVLTINELLEHIILQLPMLHILGSAMRVSRHWKKVIDDSPSIQQKLFFRSNSGCVAKPAYFGDEVDEAFYKQTLTLNGAIMSYQLPNVHPTRIPWIGVSQTLGLDYPTWICANRCFALHLEAAPLEASWRRMFLTDPPCLLVRMAFDLYTGEEIEDSFNLDIHDQYGVTLGLLEDVAAKAVTNVRQYGKHEDYDRVRICAGFEMKKPASGTCTGVGGRDGEDSWVNGERSRDVSEYQEEAAHQMAREELNCDGDGFVSEAQYDPIDKKSKQ